MFELALALGKTVGELSDSITQSEFIHWIAYFKREPTGQRRFDYGIGWLVLWMRRCVGDKSVKMEDCVLTFSKPEVKDPVEVNRRNVSAGKALLKAFGGKLFGKRP